jgi:CspA family cold shock protein
VPTGKVKWYDSEKGFGFLQTDEGEEVFLHASALPAGTLTLKNGTKCEFGVAEGKRGMQALSLRVIEAPVSIAKGTRKDAEDMAIMLEDVIKMLDGYANSLRRGRYPDDKQTEKLAAVLRAVADQIDV